MWSKKSTGQSSEKDAVYESTRKEVLCKDIIKQEKLITEQIAVFLRKIAHTSSTRGFDRSIIRYFTEMSKTVIDDGITLAERCMPDSDSSDFLILEQELSALRKRQSIILKTLEKYILEKSDIDQQIFYERESK